MVDGARGRFRAVAHVVHLEETDEPQEATPVCLCQSDVDDDRVRVADSPGGKWSAETEAAFIFDRVFGPSTKQRDVHKEELRFMADDALAGKDSALLVSGTTTSGKRHLVVGEPFISAQDGARPGIAERLVHDIFASDPTEEWLLSVSIFSIFDDAIVDLLAPLREPGSSLDLEQGSDGHVHVVDLSEASLATTADLLAAMRTSISTREDLEAETPGRDARSTLVLTLKLRRAGGGARAQVSLVDLLGAEQADFAALSAAVATVTAGPVGRDGLARNAPAGGRNSGTRLHAVLRKYLDGSSSVVVLAIAAPASQSRSGTEAGLALAAHTRTVYERSHKDGVPFSRSRSTLFTAFTEASDNEAEEAAPVPDNERETREESPRARASAHVHWDALDTSPATVELARPISHGDLVGAAELRTLQEPYFQPSSAGGTGTQVDGFALALFQALQPSMDEAAAVASQSAPQPITSAAAEPPGFNGPLSVPAVLRGDDIGALCIRQSAAPDARRSHLLQSDLPKELVALLALVRAVVSDPPFYFSRKRQADKAIPPHVILAHNVLVRIRRFHRLLEDTAPKTLTPAAVDGLLQLHTFLTVALSESLVPQVCNQAAKAIGEFYCYAHISPPVLRAADLPTRGPPGSPYAILSSGLSALYGHLTSEHVTDTGRAAVRDALRCAALSLAPPALLCDVALDAMADNLWSREVSATRTRELGLTTIYAALHRHAYAAVSRFFELHDRAAALPSKLHTLVACLGVAHSEGARSPLNLELANAIAGALRWHIGLEQLRTIVSALRMQRPLAAELMAAAAAAAALDVRKLRPPTAAAQASPPKPATRAKRNSSPRRAKPQEEEAAAALPRNRSLPNFNRSSTRGSGSSNPASAGATGAQRVVHGSLARSSAGLPFEGASLLPMSDVQTLREAVFLVDGSCLTQILPSSLLLLKALPAATVEMSTERPLLADTTAPAAGGAVLQVPDGPALRSTTSAGLCLRAHIDPRSLGSDRFARELPAEREAILALVSAAGQGERAEALWDAQNMAAHDSPSAALVHNTLVRVRRYHRLLEDTHTAEPDGKAVEGSLRMLGWASEVLQRATVAAHTLQALKFIAEYFCMHYATRRALEVAGSRQQQPEAVAASASGAVAQCIAAVFECLLANGDEPGAKGRAAREAIRCIACSEAPPLILADCALESLAGAAAFRKRGACALAVREMALTVLYIVLARHEPALFKQFLTEPHKPTGLPERTAVIVVAIGYALAEADVSALNNTLATRLAVVLCRHVGNRLAEVIRAAPLDGTTADALVRLAGIDDEKSRPARGMQRADSSSSRRSGGNVTPPGQRGSSPLHRQNSRTSNPSSGQDTRRSRSSSRGRQEPKTTREFVNHVAKSLNRTGSRKA